VSSKRNTAQQIAADKAVDCLQQFGESALFTEQEIRDVIKLAFLSPKLGSAADRKVVEQRIAHIIQLAAERYASRPAGLGN
jgi:hypothetical protein